MDINIIQKNIEILENGVISPENVNNLAALYIVRENMLGGKFGQITGEFNDIFPGYKNYIETKIKFQRNEVTEEAVIKSLSNLCTEINEFLCVLYNSTDFYKERRIILNTISNFSDKCVE